MLSSDDSSAKAALRIHWFSKCRFVCSHLGVNGCHLQTGSTRANHLQMPKTTEIFWIQSQGHSRLHRLRSPLFVFDKLNRSRFFFSGTFMGMLLLNAAPSRDVCITDLLFVTVRRSYCISHKYPLQRPISCVIVSITKFLIVIGSPRAYLSRNRRAITWVSDYRCAIWTFSNRTPVFGYTRGFHVNYPRFHGFLSNVFCSFQNYGRFRSKEILRRHF